MQSLTKPHQQFSNADLSCLLLCWAVQQPPRSRSIIDRSSFPPLAFFAIWQPRAGSTDLGKGWRLNRRCVTRSRARRDERFPHPKEAMRKVLFACVHNSGRSQMAAAFFNSFSAPSLVRGISAGPRPADRVQPEVVEAMREIGFDLRNTRPQLLTPELIQSSDLLVSFGCGELCPSVPGQRRLDWSSHSTEGKTLDQIRPIRDDLRAKIWRLVAKEGWYRLQPVSGLRSLALQPGT